MQRYLAAACAAILVVLCGMVHGFWTDRWTTSLPPAQAAERLGRVSLEVGDWAGQTLPSKSRPEGIAGQLYRRYINRVNGTKITVALFTGLPGPVNSITRPSPDFRVFIQPLATLRVVKFIVPV